MTTPRRRGGTIAAVLSAIESNPGATDTEIASQLGVSRQRVGQVRAQQQGAGPPGRRRLHDGGPMVTRGVRVPAAEVARAEERGEDLSARVRAGLGLLRAREEGGCPTDAPMTSASYFGSATRTTIGKDDHDPR